MPTYTRHGPPKVTVWTGNTADSAIILDNMVVSFEVNGSVNAGYSWSVTLMPGMTDTLTTPGDVRRVSTLYKRFQANQVVAIGFERRGGILMGLISDVRRTANHSGETISVGLTLSGRGMDKVLMRDSIIKATLNVNDYPAFKAKVDAALGPDNPVTFDLPGTWGPETSDGTPTFFGVGVQEVVDWLLANAPSMRLPLLAPATGGTGKPSEYFSTDHSITTWHDGRVYSEHLSEYQGTLWQFIRGVLDADFYECWVDTKPPFLADGFPVPQLIIRPKPFDEPKYEWAPVTESTGITWDDLRTMIDGLPYHDIDVDGRVISESLGVSDGDAFSFYKVSSQLDLICNADNEAKGIYYPLLDTYIAKKFGLTQYDARLSLLGGDASKRSSDDKQYLVDIGTEIFEARNRLFNWYRFNPFYENGSVTVVGSDSYRPGDPVRLAWVELQKGGTERGAMFYCPAVSWKWQFGGHYTTTLTLTRGHNDTMMRTLKTEIFLDAPSSNTPHFASVQF